MRQIVLDTETTGLSIVDGHRVIEIGCVELINRRYTGNNFHQYFNPEREIDKEALQVHGIQPGFLLKQPLFAECALKLLNYISNAELVIHNADFDIGFLDNEFKKVIKEFKSLKRSTSIIDTLSLARLKHPGQQNSLDALCRRYQVDNSHRDYHGALLDAKLLAEVYLALTGGQGSLFDEKEIIQTDVNQNKSKSSLNAVALPVIFATTEELDAHAERLKTIQNKSDKILWD